MSTTIHGNSLRIHHSGLAMGITPASTDIAAHLVFFQNFLATVRL